MSRFEKILASLAVATVICCCFFMGKDSQESHEQTRNEMPVGQIQMARGDTRWKGLAYGNHFRTWDKQKLFDGDALYSGAASRLVMTFGEVEITMLSQSRLAFGMNEGPEVKIQYGDVEMHLPAGERLRVSNKLKSFEVSSVNGGRVKVSTAGGLHVQNLEGDLIVRTDGRLEINIPKEEIFRAGTL